MAGLTTSCTIPTLRQPISSSSSLQTKFFGLRIRFPNNSSYIGRRCRIRIACRYAGGGSSSGFYDGDFEFESSPEDEDPALDIKSIRSRTVRLIDEQQNMVSVVSKVDAERRAQAAGLDLVIINPDADPPVVKVMDYSKYLYEQERKKKGQQKKTRRTDVKELKMGYSIDVHDYTVRLKSAQKFLKDGDKVKLIVNLKGRENQFRDKATELIRRFQNDIGELAVEEGKNFQERNMFLIMAPNKAFVQKELAKKQENPKGKEASADVSGEEVSADESGEEASADVSGKAASTDVSGKEASTDVSGEVSADVPVKEASTDVSGEVSADLSGKEASTDVSGEVSADLSGSVSANV